MIRLFGLAMISLLVSACSVDGRDDVPEATERPSPTDSVAAGPTHTLADLQALRYLEGDWLGSGYAGGPFYESYHFVNDSTIEMTSWTDSTMTTAQEHSQYALRNHVIRTDNGGRLINIDDDGHHFRRGSSTWTFRQISQDRWTAQVSPSTTYTMDRFTRQ